MTSFAEFRATFDTSSDTTIRGKQFERVCAWFLQTDPRYAGQLEQVWLWDDWPGRWGRDCGIDLVARDKAGRIWAIQAKCYDKANTVTKHAVDKFLSESMCPEIQRRLLIQTTDLLAKEAKNVIRRQHRITPINVLRLVDLHRAPIIWPKHIDDLTTGKVRPPYTPRPHQEQAIKAVTAEFKAHNRGQLLMACGTGKTLTALWIKEREHSGLTLVLLPSLSLLSQTVTEWMANAAEPFSFLPVCSDETVSKGADAAVLFKSDLVFPVTTNTHDIAAFLKQDGPRVIFSTYQSSDRIAEAQALENVPAFDVIIADEAHRCAGKVSSDYGNVLDAQRIRGRKRLFMTATPRIFTNRIVKKGREADIEIASMDNETLFGPVLHRLSFGEAINQDLLTDYQVAVIGVDDEMYQDWVHRRECVQTDTDIHTNAKHLAAQIGLAKAMKRFDLRRMISFHSLVEAAKDFSKSFTEVVNWMPSDSKPDGAILCGAVHGEMSTHARITKLQTLRAIGENERGLLANVRCLSEGVDVPTLDGVAFIDPRSSQVDIVQAVGRAIRRSEGKAKGTIVLPVFLGDLDDHDAIISGTAFKPIWEVLKALRCHDEALAEQLDRMRTQLGKTGSSGPLPDKLIIDLPTRVSSDFADAFTTRLVEATTSSFEFGLGVLQTFVEREGHARVVEGYKMDVGGQWYSLGSFVQNQRTARNNALLSKKRIQQLDDLGFVWSVHADLFEQGLKYLDQFIQREGHTRVSAKHIEYLDGISFNLGSWVFTRRARYRDNKMPSWQVKLLEARNFCWNPNEEDHLDNIGAFKQFVAREGHNRVPNRHIELYNGRERPLYTVLTNRRVERKKGKLSLQWEKEWTEAGIDWDPMATQDRLNIAAYRQYRARMGDGPIPSNHIEVYQGHTMRPSPWATTIRRRKKKHDERIATGKEPIFTEAVLVELIELGLFKDKKKEAFEQGLRALASFIEREGHVLVPQKHKESIQGFDFLLGKWVSRCRERYKQGRMSAFEIERLNELNFVWVAQKYSPKTSFNLN